MLQTEHHLQKRKFLATPHRPPTSPPHPHPLPPSSSGPLPSRPQDPLRLWFLSHLAHPFPTLSEKADLTALTGLSRKAVEEHLTNWRRRSRWTELMNLYAKGEREAMRTLVQRVESGEETRQDVLDRLEGVRAYLEERERARLGEWVKEVSLLSFVRGRVAVRWGGMGGDESDECAAASSRQRGCPRTPDRAGRSCWVAREG